MDTTTDTHGIDHLAALADQLGITRDEAAARMAGPATPQGPVVGPFVKERLAAATKNTRRTFATHLNRLADGVGPVCDQTCEPCLDPSTGFACACDCSNCTASRITIEPIATCRIGPGVLDKDTGDKLDAVAGRMAVKRGIVENRVRASRGLSQKNADGIGARETAVAAFRWLCKQAAEWTGGYDGLDVDKPRRPKNSRRPLQDFELVELAHETGTGGDDPELDQLMFDYGVATGARRSGVWGLTGGQIHDQTQIIQVKDKYAQLQPAPVSAELVARLRRFAIRRGGAACDPSSPEYRPDAPVFYYRDHRNGTYRPITSRRFDGLHLRWQRSLGWANDEKVAFHHIRHSMAAMLKSRYGHQYAKRYLRHADGDVTELYGACTLDQLAAAMGDLLDFEHPLVHGLADRRAETHRRLGLAAD